MRSLKATLVCGLLVTFPIHGCSDDADPLHDAGAAGTDAGGMDGGGGVRDAAMTGGGGSTGDGASMGGTGGASGDATAGVGGMSVDNSYRPLTCSRPLASEGWSEARLPCGLCRKASCCELANTCGPSLGPLTMPGGCGYLLECIARCLREEVGTDLADVSREQMTECTRSCLELQGREFAEWGDGYTPFAAPMVDLFECVFHAPGVVATGDALMPWALATAEDGGDSDVPGACFTECFPAEPGEDTDGG